MDRLSERLTEGTSRVTVLETKIESVDGAHREHGERLVRLETLFGTMDGKLDTILNHVKRQ